MEKIGNVIITKSLRKPELPDNQSFGLSPRESGIQGVHYINQTFTF